MTRPAASYVFPVATVFLILLVTLVPQTKDAEPALACIVCGSRGVADALLNMALFFPLGASLGGRMVPNRLVLGAALTSSVIELTQLLVPGRDASVGDVLFNTLGAWLGMLAVRSLSRWSYPESRLASRASFGAALITVSCFTLTGYLLQPAFSRRTYFGQWTPILGHLEPYRGRIVSARIGSLELPSRELADSERFRALMIGDTTLEVMSVAAPAPSALAPIFSVYDDLQREMILLGADRGHLVYRYRTRAAELRLDQPDLRLPGALADVAPGDTIELSVHRVARGHVLTHAGRAALLSFSVGVGWALLMYPEWLSPGTMQLVSVLWIMVLAVPIGFWARRRPESVAALTAVVLAFVLIPPAVGLMTTPPGQWGGLVVGLVIGGWLQRQARKQVARTSRSGLSGPD